MLYALGVDVGGTAIKAVIANANGQVCYQMEQPTPSGAQAVVEAVAGVVEKLEQAAVDCGIPESAIVEPVGVAVPGIVDEHTGIAVLSVNLGWENFPMQEALRAAIGRPVVLGHDVRSGALAEARWGVQLPSCVYVALGTGLSAAVIYQGESIVGDPWAGEVGQQLVPNPDGEGQVTLEQVCSAAAVARRLGVEGAKEVFDLAGAGDPQAQAVLGSAISYLAELIMATTYLLGPLPVVLGGGMSQAGEQLTRPLQAILSQRMNLVAPPALYVARLGAFSQALGCCSRALNSIE